jgi:hypothetical protein
MYEILISLGHAVPAVTVAACRLAIVLRQDDENQ